MKLILLVREPGDQKEREVTAEQLRERINNFPYDDNGYFNCTLSEIDDGDMHFEIEYHSIYG